MSRTVPHSFTWKYTVALPFVALLLALGLTASGPAAASPGKSGGPETKSPPVSAGAPAGPSECSFDWTLEQTLAFGNEYNQLHSVAAAAPTDVWAVGYYYESDVQGNQGLIEHWDGTQWTQVPAPHCCQGEIAEYYLYGVTVISPSDVWAVGATETGSLLQTVTMHWDGAAWSIVASPNATTIQNNVLSSVTAVSSSDVWAVGYYDGDSGKMPLMLHWDGAGWSVIPGLDTGFPYNQLFAVAAAGPDDVWAAGYYSGASGPDQTLIMHWNGSTWSAVPSPNLSIDDHNRLQGLAVAGPNDVWAVGYAFVNSVEKALIAHWNGSAWSISSSANVDGWGNSLRTVAVVGPNDIWAGGFRYYSGGHYMTLAEHWNGTSWSVATTPNSLADPTEKMFLGMAVAATDPNDVWAVGFTSYTAESPDTTIIERYHPCAETCTLSFTDVASNSPFYAYIRCLSCRSIFSGYADGTFRPGNNMTRGQIAKVVSIAAGYADDVTGRQTFSDVPPTHPFWLWIERLTIHGVMSGYGDGTFHPYSNVTRGQLSKIVVNARGWAIDTSGGPHFGDVPDTHPFYAYIETAYNHGVISGYADGTFHPYNDVTRGQAAKIVSGTFNPFCYTP